MEAFMMCLLVLVLLLCAVPSAAQPVYKCTVAGKVVYSDHACDGASSVALDIPAAPAPDPAAEEELRRQKALLAGLRKQRHAREVAEARAQARASRAAAQEARRCARLRLQQKWADEDLAKAAGDHQEALRKKARRHREAMALECPG
jgi:hypothetical protein